MSADHGVGDRSAAIPSRGAISALDFLSYAIKRNPTVAPRLILAASAACVAAILTWRYDAVRPLPSDFYISWAGFRVLWRGDDPWTHVGPGLEYPNLFPLYYPMPAIWLAGPVAWLPLKVAESVFTAIGGWLLTWTLTRESPMSPKLAALFSASFVAAVQVAQWSPLLIAATAIPALGVAYAAKPTIGAALWVAFPNRTTLIVAALFACATLILFPWWPRAWLDSFTGTQHLVQPIRYWGGPFILLALLRWKRPEARLLVALGCAPLSPQLYEALPFFLGVQTWRQGFVLAGLTWLTQIMWTLGGPYTEYYSSVRWMGQLMVWLIYLPCVAMVLCRRNEWPTSTAPAEWQSVTSPHDS